MLYVVVRDSRPRIVGKNGARVTLNNTDEDDDASTMLHLGVCIY